MAQMQLRMEKYFYSDGLFVKVGKSGQSNLWEERQTHVRYRFLEATRDENWITLMRDPSWYSGAEGRIWVRLPRSAGRSQIDWQGNDSWQRWHDMRIESSVQTLRAYHKIEKAGKAILRRYPAINTDMSAIISTPIGNTGKSYFFGSGVLIHPIVVLTSAHVIQHYRAAYPNMQDNDFEVTFRYEYTRLTPTPVLSSNRPWAKVLKVIEEGSATGVDFALLLIRWEPNGIPGHWTNASPAIENRYPTNFRKVVTVHHQQQSKIETVQRKPIYRNPTLVSEGQVYDVNSESSTEISDEAYSYAYICAGSGASGGGVYGSNGELIGIIQGGGWMHGACFCQMNKIIEKSDRMKIYQGLKSLQLPLIPINIPLPAPLLPSDIQYL